MAQSAIEKKYPQLSFLMRLFDGKKKEAHFDYDDFQKEKEVFETEFTFDDVDVIYVYGLGLGHHYFFLKKWLLESKLRDVIFIEDDLAALRFFSELECAEEILNHPQVHLRFIFDGARRKDFFHECANEFPVRKIAVISLRSYEKKDPKLFEELKLTLTRKTAMENAVFMENLHYHHLFKNLAANYQRLPSAFYASRLEGEFNNIPAIICGAGPSLKEAMPYLKFSAQKALIIAGGSTITALSSEGIETHLNFAIDPNPEEYSRLHQAQAFETPLCYGNRLQADVWNTCNGPMGYLHTCTGGASEIWMEKELGLESEDIGGEWSDEAMSVTTLAIATAAKFGCNPIILVGLDLAYTNMQSYSSGVLEKNQVFLEELKKDMRASEKLALRKDRKGKLTHTLIKWIMESSAISKFAKAHKEIEFINATSGGIGFEGIEYTPIEKVFCTLTKNFDLQGLMHERILGSKIKLPSNLVSLAFEKLRLSAIKCEEVILSAVEELIRIKDTKSNIANGKMLLFEMELFEEIAYKTLLHGPSHALDFALSRRYRTNLFEDEYNKTLAKWNHLLASTRNYLSTINTLPDRVKK